MSPFFLVFAVGAWPRMDAAVAEPCGLLRAEVFLLLLLIFYFIVILSTTDSLGLSSFLIWCPSSVQIEGGRMYQRKTNNPHLFSKIFSPSLYRHKHYDYGYFRGFQLPLYTM